MRTAVCRWFGGLDGRRCLDNHNNRGGAAGAEAGRRPGDAGRLNAVANELGAGTRRFDINDVTRRGGHHIDYRCDYHGPGANIVTVDEDRRA